MVLDEKARLEADSIQQARVQDLQHKLMLYEQKKLAQAAAEAVAVAAAAGEGGADPAGRAVSGAVGGNGSTGVSRAASVAWRKAEGALAAVGSLCSMRSLG